MGVLEEFRRRRRELSALVVTGMAGALAAGDAPGTFESWLVTVGTAGVVLGGNVAASLLASNVSHAMRSDSTNGHVNRAVGRALAGIVRARANDAGGAAKALRSVAERIEARHLPDGLDAVGIEGIRPDDVAAFFAKPSGFLAARPLSADEWRAYLAEVCREARVERDTLEEHLRELARALETDFVRALYKELQVDFANGGEAFAGVLLRLLHRTLTGLAALEASQAQVRSGLAEQRALLEGVLDRMERLQRERVDVAAEATRIVEALQRLLAPQGELQQTALRTLRRLEEALLGRLPLDRLHRTVPDTRTPLGRLHPSGRKIPFIQRQDELCRFAAWLGADAKVGIQVLTGRGGTGKTRLAIEMCRVAESLDWHAGFARPKALRVLENERVPHWRPEQPLFVVIDYVHAQYPLVRRALHGMVETGLEDELQEKLRILLVGRQGSSGHEWYEDLFYPRDAGTIPQRLRGWHRASGDFHLEALEPTRMRPLLDAHELPEEAQESLESGLASLERPLTFLEYLMRLQLYLDGASPSKPSLEELCEGYARREFAIIEKHALELPHAATLTAEVLRQLIAFHVLTGGPMSDGPETDSCLRKLLNELGQQEMRLDNARALIRCCGDPLLAPDLVLEYWVLDLLTGLQYGSAQKLPLVAAALEAADAFCTDFVTRSCADFPALARLWTPLDTMVRGEEGNV